MKFFSLVVVTCMAFLGASERPPAVFHFHLQASPHENAEKIIPFQLAQPGEGIFIYKNPFLTENEVESVKWLNTGQVLVRLNSEGQRKMRDVTAHHMGKMMVIVLNKRVVYAPMIDVVVSNGRFLIPEGLKPEEFDLLQQAVQSDVPVQSSSNPSTSRSYENPKLHRCR